MVLWMFRFSLCLLLIACAPQIPVVERSPLGCGYGHLLGQNIANVILPRDLIHRVTPPGQVITLDHNPDRVNFDVTNDGKISRVWCG